jgi:hypothetical protein
MTVVFGYGVAHKVTGEPLATGRNSYDTKNAASGALTRYRKKLYDERYHTYHPDDFEVVPLVASVLQ